MEPEAINLQYRNLKGVKPQYRIGQVRTYRPEPSEEDYRRGYITRYFVQKANDFSSHIYEVGSSEYNKWLDNPFMRTVKLDWKIKGTSVEVKLSNRKSLMRAQKKIPRIGLYLLNPLQYARF